MGIYDRQWYRDDIKKQVRKEQKAAKVRKVTSYAIFGLVIILAWLFLRSG